MPIHPDDLRICAGEEPEPPPPPTPRSVPVVTPIAQTSIFAFPTFGALVEAFSAEHAHHLYTRGQNPTVEAVERKLAALERGEACKCFASGMAAISAVMTGLLRSGDHILFVNQIYGPTLALARHLRRFGIEHSQTLELEVDAVAAALRLETKLIWLESPGTMLMRVLEVEAITGLARERGILTGIDNSWSTPLFQKPLESGVDIVMHTASKYLGGHSDLVAGVLVTSEELMRELFYRAYLLGGGILAPFDAWLMLRGLRTLPVRMRQHERDAVEVADFLSSHPAVVRVFHPTVGPDTSLAARQLQGTSGLLSFELDGGFAEVERVIDGLRIPRIGVSWGGVESVVLSPNRGTNERYLEAQGIPVGLIRLSVGLEGAGALIEDLRQALGSL